MAYINKIVVNGQEVNANQLEGILDGQGNNRFVEGNLTTVEQTGVSYNYYKWSLSGTHLMLVIAGTITAGSTVSSGSRLATVELPSYIANKIQGWVESGTHYIPTFKLSATAVGWQAATQYNINLTRYINELRISTLENIVATDNDLYFRCQIDLLIDSSAS